METEVDARGLSCPQPVLMTLEAIGKAKQGTIAILVDNETSTENVMRAAQSKGWAILAVDKAANGVNTVRIEKK
uniref:Preprotein translocase subunit TatB n=1 Tax=Desulfatirhabdium butyrativorans TaxID=340467 RepID=A0A7C4VRY8_9BACT